MNTLIILAAKYLIGVPVLGILFLWWKEPRGSRLRFLIITLASFVLAYVLAKLAGSLYFDPRPFVSEHITPLIPHAADNGFPSDHMLLASAVASVATMVNRRAGVILWLIAFFVGVARVLAGVHHPIDIIGSAVIAILATGIVAFGEKLYLDRKVDRHVVGDV